MHRAMHCNPNKEGREEELSVVFKHMDLVFLPGTQQKLGGGWGSYKAQATKACGHTGGMEERTYDKQERWDEHNGG